MSEWYYTQAGQQHGPVGIEQLRELARKGGLDAARDLVWNETMKDWTRADQIPGLFDASPTATVPSSDLSSNPYAPPQSSWVEPVPSRDTPLPEIIPGSDLFDAWACVKRGYELCKRNVGTIVIVGLIYLGIEWGLGAVEGILKIAAGISPNPFNHDKFVYNSISSMGAPQYALCVVFYLFDLLITTYLTLGLARIGLNLVSGKAATVGMLFGEGNKLLRAYGATLLFSLMVGLGLLLLIIPGIYLALRFGQYKTAIVDRDLGIMEAFSYSSSITTNNRLNLVSLYFLGMLLAFAGMLACGVGLLVAIPVIWLAQLVAYRWMQYGHNVLQDIPDGTTI